MNHNNDNNEQLIQIIVHKTRNKKKYKLIYKHCQTRAFDRVGLKSTTLTMTKFAAPLRCEKRTKEQWCQFLYHLKLE